MEHREENGSENKNSHREWIMGLTERSTKPLAANPSFPYAITQAGQGSNDGVRMQGKEISLMVEGGNINKSADGKSIDGGNIENKSRGTGNDGVEKIANGGSLNWSENVTPDLSNENMHLRTLLKSLLK